MKKLLLIFLFLGCNTPLPTEPIPATTTVYAAPIYCQTVDIDAKEFDFHLVPNNTQVFTRIAYLPTPTPQTFVSDGVCGPKGDGWEVSVVVDGKLYLVGW